jgi:hypothetical protein
MSWTTESDGRTAHQLIMPSCHDPEEPHHTHDHYDLCPTGSPQRIKCPDLDGHVLAGVEPTSARLNWAGVRAQPKSSPSRSVFGELPEPRATC